MQIHMRDSQNVSLFIRMTVSHMYLHIYTYPYLHFYPYLYFYDGARQEYSSVEGCERRLFSRETTDLLNTSYSTHHSQNFSKNLTRLFKLFTVIQRHSFYMTIYLFICLPICLSIYVFIYLSIYLSVYLFIYISINLPVYLSICPPCHLLSPPFHHFLQVGKVQSVLCLDTTSKSKHSYNVDG